MYILECENGERIKLVGYTIGEMRHKARMENAWLLSPNSKVMHTPSWA